MNIEIIPSAKRIPATITGFIIVSSSVKDWMIQLKNVHISKLKIYPLPGNQPNSVWGCLVTGLDIDVLQTGKNMACISPFNNLYIPENSSVFPYMSVEEADNLFKDTKHFFHPDIGFCKLENALALGDFVKFPIEKFRYVLKPLPTYTAAEKIISFTVVPDDQEDILKSIDSVISDGKKLKDDRLTLIEKGKLWLFKTLFNNTKGNRDVSKVSKSLFMKLLEKLMMVFYKATAKFSDKLAQDFLDLEKRNERAVDKLLEMIRNNPEEGLQYAIPLDEHGASRGSNNYLGEFKLNKFWSSFGIWGSGGNDSGPGLSIDLGDKFDDLRAQYTKTAQELEQKGDYQKAAFVYLKLLKYHGQAASCLERGKFYQEAASIYLKYTKDKAGAARCYENGNMISEAIEIHEEMRNWNKVGDLLCSIGNEEKANVYYQKTIDEFLEDKKYMEASNVYEGKMNNFELAQNTLLDGWKNATNKKECLGKYFSNIIEEDDLRNEIIRIHEDDISNINRNTFLDLIITEYKRNSPLAPFLKELGYKLIADEIKRNPKAIQKLKDLNTFDSEIIKDISSYQGKAR